MNGNCATQNKNIHFDFNLFIALHLTLLSAGALCVLCSVCGDRFVQWTHSTIAHVQFGRRINFILIFAVRKYRRSLIDWVWLVSARESFVENSFAILTIWKIEADERRRKKTHKFYFANFNERELFATFISTNETSRDITINTNAKENFFFVETNESRSVQCAVIFFFIRLWLAFPGNLHMRVNQAARENFVHKWIFNRL